MKYLLDVNVLVAWGWKDHADHERVARWLARERGLRDTVFLSSPIPELGFVRVSVHQGAGTVSVKDACSALEGMLAHLGKAHAFQNDDLSATALPTWCTGATRTTDAHLLALADIHGAKLATLDTAIPGAFLIPA